MTSHSLTEFLDLKLEACFETLAELTLLVHGGICTPTTLEEQYWQHTSSLTPGARQLFCELTILAPSLTALFNPPLDVELAKLLLRVASVNGYAFDNDPPKAFKKMSFDRRLKACLKAVRSYNPSVVKSDPEGDWVVGVSKELTVKSNPKGDWELVVGRDNVPHLYVRRGLAYVVSYLR